MENKTLSIIKHFGMTTQRKKLAEEQYELNEILQLAQLQMQEKGKISKYVAKELLGEIVDNLILIDQFVEYFDFNTIEMQIAYENKVNRTIKRIENGEYDESGRLCSPRDK